MGVCYRITTRETYSGLRISHVSARHVAETGIVLEAVGKEKGTFTDYLISGNLARVLDQIQGERGMVVDNLP